MWLRVDDEFPEHEKVLAAANRLGGKRPLARVIGVWIVSGCYASRRLTDGFVPRIFLSGMLVDEDAFEVAEALVAAGLWRPADDGFYFHDWNEYQPDAAEARGKRKRERERKRNQRLRPVIEDKGEQFAICSPAVPLLSARTDRGQPVGQPVDNQWDNPRTDERQVGAKSAPIERQSSANRALARARVPVPLRSRSSSKAEEQRGRRRAKPATMVYDVWEVRSNLLAAVHRLLETGAPYVTGQGLTEVVNLTELRETMKRVVATLPAAARPGELDSIIDAALGRRRSLQEAEARRAKVHAREQATIRRLGTVR